MIGYTIIVTPYFELRRTKEKKRKFVLLPFPQNLLVSNLPFPRNLKLFFGGERWVIPLYNKQVI